jgi:hypothetical protein
MVYFSVLLYYCDIFLGTEPRNIGSTGEYSPVTDVFADFVSEPTPSLPHPTQHINLSRLKHFFNLLPPLLPTPRPTAAAVIP